MRANFDGVRKRLASDFNRMVYSEPKGKQRDIVCDMRETMVALLCMHDPEDPDDCNSLIDNVELMEIERE